MLVIREHLLLCELTLDREPRNRVSFSGLGSQITSCPAENDVPSVRKAYNQRHWARVVRVGTEWNWGQKLPAMLGFGSRWCVLWKMLFPKGRTWSAPSNNYFDIFGLGKYGMLSRHRRVWRRWLRVGRRGRIPEPINFWGLRCLELFISSGSLRTGLAEPPRHFDCISYAQQTSRLPFSLSGPFEQFTEILY